MRAFLLTAVLLATLFAGCLTGSPGDDLRLDPTEITVPEGAELLETATGPALRWVDAVLPFKEVITLPPGATMVTASAQAPGAVAISPSLSHEETGRRRCNLDGVAAWDQPLLGKRQCSGLTAIDPPGANWTLRVTGSTPIASTITVTFSSAPLDGLVAQLDLAKLSMPTHDLQTTQVLDVPSFDGTPLRVEVTLPEGEGPWPTVIASSPYNGFSGRFDGQSGTPAMWSYFTHDWAKRGYAIVNADVRGFGLSGGCVEIWSENEQKDQAFLVDWVAKQVWSDGKVGFYGQSYVGTTPVAAAVQAPEALKAIIAVAPVINAYEDWHFGGVPNGENSLSPVAYQVLTDSPGYFDPADPAGTVAYNAEGAARQQNGLCDATLIARANDPRALYTDFYEERNFKLRAGDVQAATLFTQGFYDSNVKSAMIPAWFNAIEAPKLGLFGPWVHQHPTRADEEILFLGWMDHYVKGLDLGFDVLPAVEVVVDAQTVRRSDAWPPLDGSVATYYPDYAAGRIGDAPTEGVVELALDSAGAGIALPGQPTQVVLRGTVTQDLPLAGSGSVRLVGHLEQAPNAHVAAYLYDASPEGKKLITWGMFNIAHRAGHDQYKPVGQGELVEVEMQLLPVEHIFRAGHTLELHIRAAESNDWAAVVPMGAGSFMLHGGEEGVKLTLPTVAITEYEALPRSATK